MKREFEKTFKKVLTSSDKCGMMNRLSFKAAPQNEQKLFRKVLTNAPGCGKIKFLHCEGA